MRKLILLILITLSLLLTSCNKNINDNNVLKENTDSSSLKNNTNINMDEKDTEFQVKDLPAVTLTIDLIKTNKDFERVVGIIGQKSGLNVNFKFNEIPIAKYEEEIIKSLETNDEKVDAFISLGARRNGTLLRRLLTNNQIKDLTKLLPKYAPNIYTILIDEDWLNIAKINDKIVMIPSLCPSARTVGVMIPNAYRDKYNVNNIETIDDYIAILSTIKNENQDIIPCSNGENILKLIQKFCGVAVLDYDLGLAYHWDDKDMSLIAYEDIKEFSDIALLLSDSYKKQLIQKDVTLKDTASILVDTRYYFERGLFEGVFSGLDGSSNYFYPLYEGNTIQRVSPDGLIINNNSNNTDRLLMVLDWIQGSQENYDLANYGIKDEHYTLTGEEIDRIGRYKCPIVCENYQYKRREVFNPLKLEKEQKNILYAPHEGFYPDYSSIKEIAEKRAYIIKDEIIKRILEGELTPNSLNKTINKLKEIGTTELIGTIQRQIDAGKE